MLKSIIITGALVLAVPALAQDGLGRQASNFILGHGALAPQTSTDYPPGHQVGERDVALPAARNEKPETRGAQVSTPTSRVVNAI
jgi:hypothetical protein